MNEFVELCERAARAGGKVLLDWVDRFQVREKGPADLVTDADLASQAAIRDILTTARPEFAFIGEESQDSGKNDAIRQAPGADAPGSEDGSSEYGAAAEYQWIVDPLDGTTNYVHQLPGYSVSVALVRRGEIVAGTVFDPIANECYTAAAGAGAYLNGRRLRTSSVTQLAHALVAVSLGAKVTPDSPELREFNRVIFKAQGIRRLGSAALNLAYLAAGRFDAYWAGETQAWDIAAGVLLVLEAGGVITALDGSAFHISRPRFLAASTPPLHAELLPIVRRDRA